MSEIVISFPYLILSVAVSLMMGLGAGYFFKREDFRKKQLEFDTETAKKIGAAEAKILTAEKRAREIELSTESKAKDIISEAKDKAHQMHKEVETQQARIEQKEIDLNQKIKDIDDYKEAVANKEAKIDARQKELDELVDAETKKIEEVAKMSREEAEQKLYEKIEKQKEKDLLARLKRADAQIHDAAEERARDAIVQAIQKYASEVTSEATQTAVQLESDDMKGRIIGREGRNINAFERLTGVDVIIDDTPGVVIISGFDLLRRFIAKRAMEKLLEDGRIHPARIEEVIMKSMEEVDKMIKDFGEKALDEVGITGVAPELAKILGRFRFRTSHGQNVLQHSIEVAFIAEELANQVGANAERAKMAGLFHDLGKSVSHEIGGKHAIISGEIGRKFGLDPMVINAMEAHHEDVEKLCVEAYIVQAADAISASRPGARRDSTEMYVRRLKQQEALVQEFKGVKKCYMMSAGRDMWVFVNPDEVNDLEAHQMSQDIARRLQDELTYPGEIKVVVFRETRAEAIAR